MVYCYFGVLWLLNTSSGDFCLSNGVRNRISEFEVYT